MVIQQNAILEEDGPVAIIQDKLAGLSASGQNGLFRTHRQLC